MKAMVLERQRTPLVLADVPVPEPGEGRVLLKVHACAVCRTDLHIVDGDLDKPKLPLIPGHEIVGRVVSVGKGSERFSGGERVGVPWLGSTCGSCDYCRAGQENLCDAARFTGYDIDGGYADFAVADERFCFPVPEAFPDVQAAPLLCAGLIGYRALRMAGDAGRIGLYGFGAAAHLIAQAATYEGRDIYAFTRPGDLDGQAFARQLGAVWAASSAERPPVELDAAIIFASAGELVPLALRAVRKGGVVVCAGIHMSDIPAFPYAILWGERVIRSVANLTRVDGEEFLHLAAKVPLHTSVTTFPLDRANDALAAIRSGAIRGAAVLAMEQQEP